MALPCREPLSPLSCSTCMATAVEERARPPPRMTAPGPVTLARAMAAPATATKVTTTYIISYPSLMNSRNPEVIYNQVMSLAHLPQPCWLAKDAQIVLVLQGHSWGCRTQTVESINRGAWPQLLGKRVSLNRRLMSHMHVAGE